MKFVLSAVDRIPKELESGVVYHSEEFELAALLCACGCGHRTTLLVPDGHQVQSQNGYATVTPSIGACDAPCHSHYLITAGDVEWLPAFSGAQAQALMQRQVARHAATDPRSRSWNVWLRDVWRRMANVVRKLLGPRS